jgi:hypothetical protein
MKINDKNITLLLFLGFSLVYLLLASNLPVSIYTTAAHDDAWFVDRARDLVSGNWLGDFDQMTLIKGSGFSLVLAFNHYLGIPVTLMLAMIFLASCLLLSLVLLKAGLPRWLVMALFVLLLFQPALLPTRIIRDHVYYSFFLASLAGVIHLVTRQRQKSSYIIVIFSGLSLGLFWITREEGVWILPGLFVLFIYILSKQPNENISVVTRLKVSVAYFISAAIIPLLIGFTNYLNYGKYELVDFKNAHFVDVLNALNSVEVGPEIPYLPVPQKKREVIYQISPTFAQLKPYFEGAGLRWSHPGCSFYPHTCGDYAGSWFMWALRDGVALLGHYETPATVEGYYQQITREITEACNKKMVACSSNPIPFMPKVSRDSIAQIPVKIIEALMLTTYQIRLPLTGGYSWPPAEKLESTVKFLGNPDYIPLSEKTALIENGVIRYDSIDLNGPLVTSNIYLQLKYKLILIYEKISIYVFLIGIAAFFLSGLFILIRKFSSSNLLTISFALWVLYFSRILLLALIDVSSFPAVTQLYLLPAYQLMAFASVVSCYAFIDALKKSQRIRSASGLSPVS